MRLPPASLALPLLAGACGTSVSLTDGTYAPFDGLEYGIAAYDEVTDPESGLTLSAYAVVLSDRPDLCSALEDTESGQVRELDDVVAVSMVGVSVHDDGFDVYDTNASFAKPILSPEAGDSVVALQVVNRSGGTVVDDWGTRNLRDAEAVSDARLSIGSRSLSNGSLRRLSLSFRGTLDLEQTDPETFDVDVTDDGVPDFRSASREIRGRVSGATGCDALGTL